ncbi:MULTISPECIES: VOC family protein [unclassified Gilliamella]|uniref:VOC family protein n=1 Tax=unclassified Gilliamella TaxID=2685620 RepID=UPI002269C73B|nr:MULTISPECIES: VOC family protein [unclassified Gilliamella]MCX8602047.1 VOC family protein [Gilliamella sp. B3722]MCX8608334.1 VOC family protein [Gilliamella sp. B3771]MCX8611317.1 VOC family protein [Gilliamella sp. B3891]MCX8613889.1 VOC family protein [Gilliamella sp. B3773]MCX8616321.1 VOC family protein [Gilliamella sp. B3770]
MTTLSPQIDHVVITVSDQLDQANSQYQKLGFTTTPRGHHSLGTSNNLAIFTTTYLELLGFEPQNAGKVDKSWCFADGLTGLVFKTKDANKLYQQLVSQGIKVEGDGPKSFFRPVELNDGTKPEARFKTVRLDPSYTPNGQIFFCDQLTPELVWRKEWQTHPNGVININQVIIEAQKPRSSINLLEKTFPSANIIEIDGGVRLKAEDKFIDYLTPNAIQHLFGSSVSKANNDQDRKVALGFTTKSLAQTQQALEKGKIKYNLQNDTIIVPASETYGVVMIFSQL